MAPCYLLLDICGLVLGMILWLANFLYSSIEGAFPFRDREIVLAHLGALYLILQWTLDGTELCRKLEAMGQRVLGGVDGHREEVVA
jgi:hypothetical protein